MLLPCRLWGYTRPECCSCAVKLATQAGAARMWGPDLGLPVGGFYAFCLFVSPPGICHLPGIDCRRCCYLYFQLRRKLVDEGHASAYACVRALVEAGLRLRTERGKHRLGRRHDLLLHS